MYFTQLSRCIQMAFRKTTLKTKMVDRRTQSTRLSNHLGDQKSIYHYRYVLLWPVGAGHMIDVVMSTSSRSPNQGAMLKLLSASKRVLAVWQEKRMERFFVETSMFTWPENTQGLHDSKLKIAKAERLHNLCNLCKSDMISMQQSDPFRWFSAGLESGSVW
jgi:hypothetical protein